MAEKRNKRCEDGPKEESPTWDSGSPSHDSSAAAANVEHAEEAEEGRPRQGGWWGDWLSIAKDKSVEVLGMVKKDLDELSTAVKSEASHVINTTSSAIGKTLRLDEPESTANTMKKSFSTFLDQVNTVLNPSPDDDDTEVFIVTDGEPVPLTSLQKEILALQRLDATYLVAPEGETLERLQAWRRVHNFPSQAALERQLRASCVLREKIERLVPAALEANDFWERYLFRKALLEDRLCNLNNPLPYLPSDTVISSLLGEAPVSPPSPDPDGKTSPSDSVRSNCGSTPPDSGETNVQWDNDFAMDVELSEEQQIKLLEEYEEEIKSSKQTSTLPSKKSMQKVKNSPSKSASSPQLRQTNQNKSEKTTKPSTNNNKSPKKGSELKSKSAETVANVQKTIGKKIIQEAGKKQQGKAQSKSDLQSKMIEDHFVDDNKKIKGEVKSLSEELAENTKGGIVVDNASSNSDESWEKEFEFEDVNPV